MSPFAMNTDEIVSNFYFRFALERRTFLRASTRLAIGYLWLASQKQKIERRVSDSASTFCSS